MSCGWLLLTPHDDEYAPPLGRRVLVLISACFLG